MFAVFKKAFLACIFVLAIFATSAWQSDLVVLAKGQNINIPPTPLYSGLTWSNLGSSSREITINANGDAISRSGEVYKAAEQFASGIVSRDVLDYYSNGQLAKSGWVSYDAFEGPDGTHYIFYHESGVYLSVEFLKCPRDLSSVCVTIWKSEQMDPTATNVSKKAVSSYSTATSSFGKSSPANGATNLNPTNIVLSWEAYSPTPDKYSYCIKEGSVCDANDPNWTGTYTNTSVTLNNLSYGKTYYWQVKAITCLGCVPKVYVYADGGTWWTFTTKLNTQAVIIGNAGVAGAILSYTDGTLKTVTADSTGAYSITVPYNWSGTVTPSKSGYLFSPKSATFSNLTAIQTIQNFIAGQAFTISGNTGIGGVTLSYTDGTPQTVTSDGSGNYSIIVPQGWSGTVTPSKTGFNFLPVNKSYVNVVSNQTAQNYLAIVTISGNAGIAGATLSYTDGTPKTVIADGSGNYSIVVPYGWYGTVTPSKIGYGFLPTSRSYVNVTTALTAQNYTALVTISGNVGVGGATLSYTDGVVKLATSQSDGSYSFPVSYNWNGTVTPTHTCFTFSPTLKSYSNVLVNQTAQDYVPTLNGAAGCADIQVKIGGNPMGRYGLTSGQERRENYAVSGGPVMVHSTNVVDIVAAIRLQSFANNTLYSFVETMGVPQGLLSYKYYFPTYNNTWTPLNSQLRFANLDASGTTVRITIGSTIVWEDIVPGLSEKRLNLNVSSGPVIVESLDNTKKIVAAIRLQSFGNNTLYSFAETMGIPVEQLSDTYYFPTYNNTWAPLNSQLRIGNLDASDTTVRVTIGSTIVWEDVVPGLTEQRLNFNVSGGPVKVESLDPTKKIVAAIRLQSFLDNTLYSFAETMGVPQGLLSSKYYFPTYNNTWAPLNSQLRFANLDPSDTTVRVTIGGVVVWEDIVPGLSEKRLSFNVSGGPVIVESLVNTRKIVAAIRLQSFANNTLYSFAETLGIPAEQLSDTYYFSTYNNTWAPLNSQLRFGMP